MNRTYAVPCGYDLAINREVFPNTPRPSFGSVFWTSTSDVSIPSNVWMAVFDRGGVVTSRKESRIFVRLVRGGQPLDSFDAQAPPRDGPRRRAVKR